MMAIGDGSPRLVKKTPIESSINFINPETTKTKPTIYLIIDNVDKLPTNIPPFK